MVNGRIAEWGNMLPQVTGITLFPHSPIHLFAQARTRVQKKVEEQGCKRLTQLPSRRFHGCVDAGISATTANVAGHPRVDVFVGGVRDIVE